MKAFSSLYSAEWNAILNIKKTWWHSKKYRFVIWSSFVMHIQCLKQFDIIIQQSMFLSFRQIKFTEWKKKFNKSIDQIGSEDKQGENKWWQNEEKWWKNVAHIRVDLKCNVNFISIRDFCALQTISSSMLLSFK